MKRLEKRKDETRPSIRNKAKVDYTGAYTTSDLYFAKGRNGKWMDARIIEVRPLPLYYETETRGPDRFRYYVHFEGKNRRLDQWVTHDQVKPWDAQESAKPDPGPVIQHNEHEGLDEKQIAQHEEVTKLRRIEHLEIGAHRCQTWYFTPLPEHLQDIDTLYVCEFCLNFFKHKEELERHSRRCTYRHPPGNEIYRDGNVSVFEVDGGRNPTYSENLCFTAKLFLDHKTLAFDVTPFLFYVLTENDATGCRFTGYFSKEKKSDQGYNLACILVMPYAQGAGYGKFLIALSYELSRIEKRMGTPERPLSDMGFKAYFKWWAAMIIEVLKKFAGKSISINELSQITYIREDDILLTLEKLNMLRYTGGNWSFYANEKYLDQVWKTLGQPGRLMTIASIMHTHQVPLRILYSAQLLPRHMSLEPLFPQFYPLPGVTNSCSADNTALINAALKRFHRLGEKGRVKLENLRYRFMRGLKKMVRGVFGLSRGERVSLVERNGAGFQTAYERLQNWCLRLKPALLPFAELTNGPKADSQNPTSTYTTYNNSYMRTVFRSSAVRLVYRLFVEVIFSDWVEDSLSSRFKMGCCSAEKHCQECVVKWRDLKKALERYLGADVPQAAETIEE